MHISLFDKFGALNSAPVFSAFARGLDELQVTRSSHDMRADVAVIWSTVWAGRMRQNQRVYHDFRSNGRAVVVLEVGTLYRGRTWKIGVNGTGHASRFCQNLDVSRPQHLEIAVKPWRDNGDHVLICCQREDSQQWHGMPNTYQWLDQTVAQIRAQTLRPIWIRPHPRRPAYAPAGTRLLPVHRLVDTYDSYDLENSIANAHCVINWNSGPAVRACLEGVPVFCGPDSLAAPVSNQDWQYIDVPEMPLRDEWLVDVCHTEWTVPEIESGTVLRQLLNRLQSL